MDSFEKKLEEESAKLKSCQKEHNLLSCYKCDELLDCKVRDDYVDAVYKSMSKGKAGEFNFKGGE
ncbi:hypothetical protein [uncultured Campylobacter sp.]|uniref:hypothetical protein n=1 Tax=uncultured Campylobacter sp. TaxID=218934 RepID=UPI00263041BB|nr:hypothetical protein [uncultured Campylobacter sp.]